MRGRLLRRPAHDYDNPEAGQYFSEDSTSFLAEDSRRREDGDEHLLRRAGGPATAHRQGVSADWVSCLLDFEWRRDSSISTGASLYMRTGVAKVTFRAGDAVFTRGDVRFVPDRWWWVRVSSSRPDGFRFASTLRARIRMRSVEARQLGAWTGTWKGPNPDQECVDCGRRGKAIRLRTGFFMIVFERSVNIDGRKSEASDEGVGVHGAMP